jgi:hypothetical protein
MTLEARAACADLIAAFAYHVDHRAFASAVALFAENGRFERPDMDAVGHDQIAALWKDRPETLVTRHLCGPPCFLGVDEREVRAATWFTLYIRERAEAGPALLGTPTAVGEYHDRFVLERGRWRIGHRQAVAVLADR